MSDYRFDTVHLVWVPVVITPMNQITLAADDAAGFPLDAFREHCVGHDSSHCTFEDATDHGVLDPSKHTYPYVTDTQAASTALFDGFSSKSPFSLGDHVESSTSGTGGVWQDDDTSIAYQLKKNGSVITKNGNSGITLYLEFTGGFHAARYDSQFDLTVTYSGTASGAEPLVVRLARTRGKVTSVRAIYGSAGRTREVELARTHDDRTYTADSPTVSAPELMQPFTAPLMASVSSMISVAVTIPVEIRIAYQGERPSIIGKPEVRAVKDGDISSPENDYQRRVAEIGADVARPDATAAERAEVEKRRRVKRFFLEYDVQFRGDMRALWVPLTPRDHEMQIVGNPRWRDRRAHMIELMLDSAGPLALSRLVATSREDHENRVHRLACAYGGPGSWSTHRFSEHVEELALAQELVVRRHFGRDGTGRIDMADVRFAFDLFSSGAIRSDPSSAFRNGEPDSSLMFFWADFADQVLRWCGDTGLRSLSAEQTWFWAGFRDVLIEAADLYRRHYRPTGDAASWKDYGSTLNPAGPLPALERPPGTSPSDFDNWKAMLVLCFAARPPRP